jgi:hypothetical protein
MGISEENRGSEGLDDAERLLNSKSFCIVTVSSTALLPSQLGQRELGEVDGK